MSKTLIEIVGQEHAIHGDRLNQESIRCNYLTEERGLYEGHTSLILKPGSAEEISQILQHANEKSLSVVVQGGNTGLVGGQIPHGSEILLCIERLNSIRSIDMQNDVAIVEAGVTLGSVQKAAEAQGRMFPLDIGSRNSCQIGGNLATNAGGVQVLSYGTMRDLTLGLEVVLPNGKIISNLQPLRKDNSTFDLRNLFIGSEGALGVITAATLKLFRRPASISTAFVALPSLDCVLKVFQEAKSYFGRHLITFEFMSDFGMQLVLRHFQKAKQPFTQQAAYYVLIETEQYDDAENERIEEFFNAFAESEIEPLIAQSLQQRNNFWAFRDYLPKAQKLEGFCISNDISVPISRIKEFIHSASASMRTALSEYKVNAFGHLGDGNIHFNVIITGSLRHDQKRILWECVTDQVACIAVELGGSFSAEHGVGCMKKAMVHKHKGKAEIEILQGIKSIFDPHDILNSGKTI